MRSPLEHLWERRTITAVAAAIVSLAVLVQPGTAQQAKRLRVRGYVIQVLSPTQFLLDDIRIVEDRTYRVKVDDVAEVGDVVRIGADLEVSGTVDASTDELQATTLRHRAPPEDKTPDAPSPISTAVLIDPGERRLWNWLRLEIKEPDFDRRRSGRVIVQGTTDHEVIASAEVQAYVADVGAHVVPAFQRDLEDGDPAKIPFRFFVVRNDQAGATAVGPVIMVHTRTFEILKNEAQLASVLAHEIAHVTQKHFWKLDQMVQSSIKVGFVRSYENQADRLALEYMTSAGYDPREAARTWKLFAMKLGFTPLRETHESHPVRRAFIMGELEAHFDRIDYSALRVDEERYAEIAESVKKLR